MKIATLRKIIEKDASKDRFAVLTNITNGNSEIFELGKTLSKEFKNYKKEIENHYNLKKNGMIKDTQIFIENHIKPIEVIILGAVHIAQYLIDFTKNFNFNVTIIDPRKYFISNQRFENTTIISDWPNEAFKTIETNSNTALIALTHDPKIDDPALQHALKNNFFYIGALGSKKTHGDRCQRLKKAGFSDEEINNIHGPIGIKLGGKSAAEIALSIISQLILETNKL